MSSHWNSLVALAEQEVRSTLQALPADIRSQARNLPITFEPKPGDDLVADDVAPDTLGLFVGDAYPDGVLGGNPLPPQIILFLENLWDFAEEDAGIYREEIRTTLLHELGHYLGLDELDLEERGLD
jgi:predicted Zn-dependent protease with MMP-like domain